MTALPLPFDKVFDILLTRCLQIFDNVDGFCFYLNAKIVPEAARVMALYSSLL